MKQLDLSPIIQYTLVGLRADFPASDYQYVINPFRTAVSFWGLLGANYLELAWFVPKTGIEF